MDGFTEKKWFVYMGDHHEGPMSLADVQSKMSQGQISSTNYVWADGMADWLIMTEVQAFASLINPPPILPPTYTPPPSSFQVNLQTELAPTLDSGMSAGFSAVTLEPAFSETNSNGISAAAEAIMSAPVLEDAPALESPPMDLPPILEAAPVLEAIGSQHRENGENTHDILHSPLNPDHETLSTKTNVKVRAAQNGLMKTLKAVALILILVGFGIVYKGGFLSSAPSLSKVSTSLLDPIYSLLGISPIPKLDDVSPEEYEQLKAAAKTKIESQPKISVALSKSDLFSPTFYVGTNLPDGAIFDIYLEGIPETLLNRLSFTARTQVTITKKFGKSGVIQFPADSRTMAPGQYVLFVVDPETQSSDVKPLISRIPTVQSQFPPTSVPKGLRVIGTKSYFLGGLRDATYAGHLKEFHEKLQAKAQQELIEVGQFASTFEAQLSMTNLKFLAFKKGRKISPSQKKAWNEFHSQWDKMNQQLSLSFAKLTPESVKNDYFYGSLYVMSKETEDAVNQLHNLQNAFFTGAVPDLKAFDIQLGEVKAIAHSAVDALKTKVDQIQKLPPDPSGLPKKDGI